MDIAGSLEARTPGNPLRFVAGGDMADGKSTLIGRLLHESKMPFADQLATLESGSGRAGTQGGALDLSMLIDGPTDEREWSHTIDVAHRYFSTDRRSFIAADAPGHERYTRNMVTGASTADVAVILVDARHGIRTQTRRHSYLVTLLGIRKVALAINKLDLVGYDRVVVERIEVEYREFASRIGLAEVTCIPLSALRGDNVVARSPNMPWHQGPTLMQYLETVEVNDDHDAGPFRMLTQWMNRRDPDFCGISGRVVGGTVRLGDRVRVLPSGRGSAVARIVTRDGDLPLASCGQSVTLALADEVDVSRGDVVAAATAPPAVADQFEATLVWMSEEPMLPGRPYLMKIGARTVGLAIGALKYKVNVDTLEHLAAKTLNLNAIGVCNLSTAQPIAFDPYDDNRDTGGFVVIDRITNNTVGAGLLHFALRRSQNIHWQSIEVNKAAHAAHNGHAPCVVWFTGLSGAGKSTIANLVEKRLLALGLHTYLLDGDNVRHGLNKDLGFTEADRVENIRRVAEVAKLMVDAGLIVLVSFISPFRAERRMARELVGPGEFCEVYVDTPLAVAEARDTKGLYRKARAGQLANFTGIDSPYEPPENAEIRVETTALPAADAAELIVNHVHRMVSTAP